MVNTGRFVILVLAYRLLVPLLSGSAQPDHTTKEVVLLLLLLLDGCTTLELIGSSAATTTQVAATIA